MCRGCGDPVMEQVAICGMVRVAAFWLIMEAPAIAVTDAAVWDSPIRREFFHLVPTVVSNQLVYGPGVPGATVTWAIKSGGGRLPFHYHIHIYNWSKLWLWLKNTPIVRDPMTIVVWTSADIAGLETLGIVSVVTELDDRGCVLREIGLNSLGDIVYSSPTENGPLLRGLFDGQVIDLRSVDSVDPMRFEEFEALWQESQDSKQKNRGQSTFFEERSR